MPVADKHPEIWCGRAQRCTVDDVVRRTMFCVAGWLQVPQRSELDFFPRYNSTRTSCTGVTQAASSNNAGRVCERSVNVFVPGTLYKHDPSAILYA